MAQADSLVRVTVAYLQATDYFPRAAGALWHKLNEVNAGRQISAARGRVVEPEKATREAIDAALAEAGWLIQDVRAVIQWAFAGKLVAQDPADEPAGMLLEWIWAESEMETGNIGRSAPLLQVPSAAGKQGRLM